MISEIVEWLTPYRFSWLAITLLPLSAGLYARGMQLLGREGQSMGFWRPLSFFVGVLLCYAVMHTRLDYYGQYLFFAHRGQHLVLHHLGALLIALGNPVKAWRAALPFAPPSPLAKALLIPVRLLQHPVIGSFVFFGLIYLWLTPEIHFDAMLSHELYLLMNWSMFIDGVLFWLVIVDPRPPEESRMPGYGTRLFMIVFTAIPQIILGAYITFSRENLYDVYAVCGRAWPISSEIDQLWGGLLTWIPPAMMEVVAALIVLSMIMRRERYHEATG
ncbi:MAG: cytochrome c oxidase assembly protein [Pseudomonadales bacterium]|nr:cytochrome c oxidase assembly protein [Pseudomonadales bacterium]